MSKRTFRVCENCNKVFKVTVHKVEGIKDFTCQNCDTMRYAEIWEGRITLPRQTAQRESLKGLIHWDWQEAF